MDWPQGRGACLKAQGVKVSAMLGCHLVLDSEKDRWSLCNSIYPSVKWDTHCLAHAPLTQRNPYDAHILKEGSFCPVLKKNCMD